MKYPTWIVHTLTGNTQVVEGYLEVIGEGSLVRIYQEKKPGELEQYDSPFKAPDLSRGANTRTEFLAAIMNIEYVVRDDEEGVDE